MHPCWCQAEIIEKSSSFRCRERALQVGAPLGSHVLAAEFTKRLNQKAAQSAGRFHVARSGAPQLDGRATDDYGATGAIGEKHHLRRHLLCQAKGVGGIRTSWLQADAVAAGDRSRHRFWRRRERTELRVLFWIVVDPSGQPADRPRTNEPVQGNINRPSVSEVKKIRRHNDAPPAPTPEDGEDSCVEGLR